MARTRVLFALAGAFVFSVACTQASMPPDGSGSSAASGHDANVSGSQQSDWAAIERLEQQAKGMAKTTGCSSSDQCRSAPVGSKGCGGPRYYIPWCAKSTDSVALYAKLAEVVKAEQAYNKRYQIISTCEFRVAPKVEVAAGACMAK